MYRLCEFVDEYLLNNIVVIFYLIICLALGVAAPLLHVIDTGDNVGIYAFLISAVVILFVAPMLFIAQYAQSLMKTYAKTTPGVFRGKYDEGDLGRMLVLRSGFGIFICLGDHRRQYFLSAHWV